LNKKKSIDISGYADEQIERELGWKILDSQGSLHEWFTERGYDIDANVFYLNFVDRPWSQKIKDIKVMLEVINHIGPEKLIGKSLKFSPGSNTTGYEDHPELGKRLNLGLDASIKELVETIQKNLLNEASEEKE
jgi:hypothetical protein